MQQEFVGEFTPAGMKTTPFRRNLNSCGLPVSSYRLLVAGYKCNFRSTRVSFGAAGRDRAEIEKSNQFGYFFRTFVWKANFSSMNIYNRSSLIRFYEKHPDCKMTLEKWYHDVRAKNWKKPGEITRDFNTARTIKNNRVIFRINENDYRLIAEINYLKGWVFMKFIGTHAAYDKVNATTIEMF